jgi:hypothetical protein
MENKTVVAVGKMQGTKPQEQQQKKEPILLNGTNKVDYRKGVCIWQLHKEQHRQKNY